MASKLTLLEEEWARQPNLPVRLSDKFSQGGGFFTFGGANTLSRTLNASVVPGPSGLATATDGGSSNYFALKKFPFAQIGQIWLAVFSTQATAGQHAIVGEVDNSTSYIEDFFINCAADTYVAGSCETTIRDTAGNMLRAYTGNIGFNDGKVRTAVFFLESPTAFRCFVDGAEKPLTHANSGTLSGLAGTMEYEQWMHTRNLRGAGQYGSSTSQRIYLYARLIGNVETARLLSKNPWQIFEPEEIPLFKPVAIGATLAQTESADTVTSAANVQLSASLAVTESNDSLSSAATVAIFASLSVTESSDTVTASATIIDGVNASLSVTESDDTLSASSSVPLSASLSYTESADSASGSASVTINATATLTEAGDSISGVSVVEITATASLTESADSLSASATLVDGINASLNVSEASDMLAAVANAAIAAALSESEAGDELSAQAAIALSAAMNAVESGDTVVSAVSISITCSASLSENGDTLTATASIISDSNTITAASMVRLAEIWARMELDATKPLSTSATLLTVGTISQDISTGGAVRTGAAMVPSIDPDTMIAEVWQRLGLDPDNALTQTNTSIDVGDIHLTVSGTDTLTVQRV